MVEPDDNMEGYQVSDMLHVTVVRPKGMVGTEHTAMHMFKQS